MRKIFSTTLFILIGFVIAHAQPDPVFTSPGHYGQTFISYSLADNIFYAAPYRFRVTSTVQNSNVAMLFDQHYDNPAISVSAAQSTTITIDLKAKNGNSLLYPAGYLYVNCYQENNVDSIYTRLYDSTNSFADFEWEEWNNVSTTSPYKVMRLHIPEWVVSPSKIELKLFAQTSTPLILTEIEYYLENPGQFEKGIITKSGNNTVWSNLSVRDTGNVQRAFVNNNGNASFTQLGIGTTSLSDTSYKLLVNGTIRSHKIKVDHDNWPDYVFSEGYKLHSLTYLASYIKANQHLPGVPSATEIKEQGLDIAENQAILMKKIEELTLYLFQQNKKIQQQQQQLHRLQKAVKTKPGK